jgi:hypothetical protein
VHERLAELLPGTGDVAKRYETWLKSTTVPPERVIPALRDIVAELRGRVAELVELPAGEGLVLEEVHDEPWWAFNYYRGGRESRVVVNLDVPASADDVVELAAHEVYPGHHTERALKEQLLLHERGLLEESIQMVPTPAALVSEGIAETGSTFVLDGDMPERLVGVFRSHGVEYDLELARGVRQARRPLRRLGLDGALMIHEDGATAEEARAYLERWGLRSPEEAKHAVRFVTNPTWRAYTINYSAGYDVCHAWVGGDPKRFTRLLTEHVRVSDLVAAISSGS